MNKLDVSILNKILDCELSLREGWRIRDGIREAEKQCKRFGIRGFKPPSTEEVIENKVMELNPDDSPFMRIVKERDKHILNEIMNFGKIPEEYLRESENLMRSEENERACVGRVSGKPDMWTMYDVIVVDKESLKILKDERVVAKNVEHAKGKAGYYDVLADKCHDNTKLVVKIAMITDIRPVEDAE